VQDQVAAAPGLSPDRRRECRDPPCVGLERPPGAASAKEAQIKGSAATARASKEPESQAVSAGRHVERVRAQAFQRLVREANTNPGPQELEQLGPRRSSARLRCARAVRIPVMQPALIAATSGAAGSPPGRRTAPARGPAVTEQQLLKGKFRIADRTERMQPGQKFISRPRPPRQY
jgi:hypothetical protein